MEVDFIKKPCDMCYGVVRFKYKTDYDEFVEELYLCEDCQMPRLRRIYK